MSFSGIVLTDDGKNELAAAEMGGSFRITDIVLGEGLYSGERSAAKAVVSPVMTLPVSKIERDPQMAGRILIECDFNSVDVPKAFYWREIGIIANKKLCYYDNSADDAEYFDPVAETVIKQKRMRIILQISSDVPVNISISSSLYATDEEMQKILYPEYTETSKLEHMSQKESLFVMLSKLSKGLTELIKHLDNRENPHNLTVEQLKLEKVNNTADSEKSVKYAASAGSAAKDGKGNNIADTYAQTDELKEVAFSGSYADLKDVPTIPAAVAVKGAAEKAYRTGNVNMTPANLGLDKVDNTADSEKSVKYATSAGSAAKDGKGNNIADTYAQTDELKEVAFSGSYADLEDVPTIPAAVAVKGAAETAYRTGNVNITPANLGLGKVQNTADSEKSVKYATSAGSAAKDGKGNNIADTYMTKTGDASNATVTFTQATTRANIATGETTATLFGKIKKWFADMTAAAFAQVITSNTDLMATTVAGYLPDALAVKQQFDSVNSNFKKVAYPYTNYTDITLRGYISKLQNDQESKKRYVIFVPIYQSPYSRYGVKTIKTLVIQGVAIIRQNATDQTGYTVTNAVQDYQGIRLSVLTDNDISGYLCDCTFDFYGT